MEIKYSSTEVNPQIFGRTKICGLIDKTGNYMENLLPNLRTVKANLNMTVGLYLKLNLCKKNKKIITQIKEALEIDKNFERRLLKTLSTSELIKVQVIFALLANSKTIIIEDIDKYLTPRDLSRLFLTIFDQLPVLNKTIFFKTNNIDCMLPNAKRYVVVEGDEIIFAGDNYRDVPETYAIKEFVDLANKKGAKLYYYKDDADLLKAIFRSVHNDLPD